MNKCKFKCRDETGFSLVDLVVTIVILGILAASAATRFVDLSQSAEITACKSNQMSLEAAQQLFFISTISTHNGRYAEDLVELAPYMRSGTIPDCPEDGSYRILEGGRIECTNPSHARN